MKTKAIRKNAKYEGSEAQEETAAPVTEAKISAMDKFAQKLEAKKVGFLAVMLECDAPDVKEDMHRATIKKALDLVNAVNAKLALAAKVKAERTCGKDALKAFVSEQNDTLKSVDAIPKKLTEVLSDISDSRTG